MPLDSQLAIGMAACDPQQATRLPHGPIKCLSQSALIDRLEEEIYRAARHRTALACLLLRLDGLEEIRSSYGSELSEQMLEHISQTLRCEFRRFDRLGHSGRGEFLVVLPGADSVRGEIVARRVLRRLNAIKIQQHGKKHSMEISAAVATWHDGQSAAQLISQARAAAAPEQLGFQDAFRI